MLKQLRPPLVMIALLTLLCGVLYPALVTTAAQLLFPRQANGSIIRARGKAMASSLIGQPFRDARYFWPRLSATAPVPYNAASSAGSNLGPSNPALAAAVSDRVAALRAADPGHARAPLPVDLITSSASGLDPHISPAAAYYQAPRVARARRLPESRVRALISFYTQGRQLGLLGEPRVNVLALNLALDRLR